VRFRPFSLKQARWSERPAATQPAGRGWVCEPSAERTGREIGSRMWMCGVEPQS
jgi:hypothetical protein